MTFGKKLEELQEKILDIVSNFEIEEGIQIGTIDLEHLGKDEAFECKIKIHQE